MITFIIKAVICITYFLIGLFSSFPALMYRSRMEEKMKEAKNKKETNSIRRKVRLAYYSWFVVFGLVCYVIYKILVFGEESEYWGHSIVKTHIYATLTSIIAMIYHLYTKREDETHRISTATIADIPSKFILYLRGFDSDDYASTKKDIDENPINSFSEVKLVEILGEIDKVLAVGMSKEIESPVGAKRIYFDDNEWQQGVKLLMQKAHVIVILLEDRESCIWEIAQSQELLDKTFICVTDNNKYDNVRKKLEESFMLPDIRTINEGEVICISIEDGQYKIAPCKFEDDDLYDYIESRIEGF